MHKLSFKVGLYLITGLIVIFSAQIITRVYWQLPQLSEMEQSANLKDQQRLEHALDIYTLDMLALACETGSWDVIQEFIENGSHFGLINSMMQTDYLNGYFISGINILDTQNNSHWSFEGKSNVVDFNRTLNTINEAIISKAKTSSTPATLSGNILVDNQLVAFGACEIRPEDEDIPAAGSSIYWRVIDHETQNEIRKYSQLEFDFIAIDATPPINYKDHQKTLIWIIEDYLDNAILQAVIYLPGPHIHIELFDEQTIIGIGISIAVFLILIATLNLRIIKPIKALKLHIEDIQEHSDYSRQITTTSNDEIASLSRGLNRFMEHILHQEHALKAANRKFKALSDIDPLTGIPNRRAIENFIKQNVDEQGKTLSDISIIMIDADNFKLYNDNYGHQKGDEVLKALAATIQQNTHSATDMAARFGGEEFIVVLTQTTKSNTDHVANNLVSAISALNIEHAHNPAGKLTISAGYTHCSAQQAADVEQLIALADTALYQAKEQGRNCARFNASPSSTEAN